MVKKAEFKTIPSLIQETHFLSVLANYPCNVLALWIFTSKPIS